MLLPKISNLRRFVGKLQLEEKENVDETLYKFLKEILDMLLEQESLMFLGTIP